MVGEEGHVGEGGVGGGERVSAKRATSRERWTMNFEQFGEQMGGCFRELLTIFNPLAQVILQ